MNDKPGTSDLTRITEAVTVPGSEQDDLEGSHGARQRHSIHKIKPGSRPAISVNYESLDYDTCENRLLLDEESKRGYPFVVCRNMGRWFVILLIGVLTSQVAFILAVSIKELGHIKYKALKKSVNKYMGNLVIFYFLWVVTNLCIVTIGSTLIAYVEPAAAGSGIPQVKCFLNGVMIPRLVHVKTLLVKCVGVISAVIGGLAGGMEGPMIHCGSVVAASVSQCKSACLKKDVKLFQYFREDHEKRDFISAGAASGVSAAFGAPVGGLLLSLEEGASFWNQSLTWRTFFCTVVATFGYNFAMSTYMGHPGLLSHPGLLNLGKIEPFVYKIYEVPVFIFFGVVGGVLGSIWNFINFKLAIFRLRHIQRPRLRILEAWIVTVATTTTGFVMMVVLHDCRPLGEEAENKHLKMYCAEGEYNALAALWFQTPDESFRSMLHEPMETYKPVSVLVFFISYFLISLWTFGLTISSGLFMPCLLTGSAWGRLIATGIQFVLPNKTINPTKYALIGAAAQLGGVARMTISLTVMLIEATGQISNALPIIVTLVISKWVGDLFTEDIYEINIHLGGVPMLPWEFPPVTHHIYAAEVMSHPVITLRTVENVGHIVETLLAVPHNGFPVVDPTVPDDLVTKNNRMRGLILRDQLIVLIKNKLYIENESMIWSDIDMHTFRREYPVKTAIEKLHITEWDKACTIDLRPFMNPTPYTLPDRASLPRVFRLFRGLGLRHIPIVNDVNEVVGMVTRKDIARYRVRRRLWHMGLEKLPLTK